MADNMLDGAELPVDSNGNIIQLRDWEDHEGNRKAIYDDVQSTMARQFAHKEHNGVALSITDVEYADPEYRSIAEQKKILHNDGYLHRRLRGTVTLTDVNTGEVLDRKENFTLMKVPMWTNRGTFIRDGNEWGTINQTRLMPGAYSRWQNNGDLETQFNVRTGTGGAIRINFDPEKAVYKFKTGGQEFHLYSLLHDIGVSDDEMRKSWGDEVFAKNAEGYDPRTFEKAYNKLVPEWDRKQNPARGTADKATLIKNVLNRAQVAKFAVQKTLPNWFDRTKQASWQRQGACFEKLASLSADNLRDIAAYINQATGKQIDTELGREALEEALKNVVTSGTPTGTVDPADKAAAVVRQLQQARTMATLERKLEKMQQY